MGKRFVGREQELKQLRHYLAQDIASLMTITGRRRVGKSRLVEEFAKGHSFIRFSGIAPGKGVNDQTQRDDFARRLQKVFSLLPVKNDDWADLFDQLAEQTKAGQHIILFDEASWMAMNDSTFLPKLKNAWDEQFKQNPKLILIVCGSISSWIEKNILSSTGYVGRVNFSLRLKELPIQHCSEFWGAKRVAAYEKLKVLSVTGGIPLYLENVDVSQSAESNIKRLCFDEGGLLVREFDNIFNDFFAAKSPLYASILRALIEGHREISVLCSVLDMEASGLISDYLNDLEQSGFITRDYTWDFKSGLDRKFSRYRLSDNYARFYLSYIEKAKSKIDRGNYELVGVDALPNYDAMMGLQFENLVLSNRYLIKDALNIPYGDVVNDNPYFQRVTKKVAGCQIDYLIQTRFNTLYVIEIKFSKNPVGTGVVDELELKIERIAVPKAYSIRPVLIHVGGVTDALVGRRYFDKIIDFSNFV